MKKKKVLRVASLLMTGVLTISMWGCTASDTTAKSGDDSAESGTNTASKDESVSESVTVNYEMLEADYSDDYLNAEWDESTAVKITLNESSANIEGSGASEENGTVTISNAGTYVISGTLTDGQIIVNAQSEDVVHIVLNQASITCSSNSAIYGAQSDKIILTLADGTENEMTDGSEYQYADSETDEPDAAIFSKDDLAINGTGSLKVNGNYQDGIRSKDDLVIISGTIDVTAADDGIKGKDSVIVKDAAITVNAVGDGIKSNNDTETDKGYVLLENGTYTITSGNDGIQAETVLQINGGTYQIISGGGSAEAAAQQTNGPGGNMPQRDELPEGMQMPSDSDGTAPEDMQPPTEAQKQTAAADTSETQDQSAETQTADTAAETTSMKGLKGSGAVFINDGTLTIDSCDDTIHSNGDVTISGGSLTLCSGDDGIHADSNLVISNGTIDITKSYEGLEGLTIDITGGNIHLNASDDGLNAAGGSDSTTSGNGFGADMFAVNEDAYIRITDGYLYVNASGDGIDSNGNIAIDGGIVLVDGPVNGGDGAFDFNGTAEITNGIVIAAGSAGMAESFSDSSAQNSVMVYYSEVQSAGTLLNLSDSDGNSIVSYAPEKEYQTVLISTPALQTGSTYLLSSGGEAEGTGTDGYFEAQPYLGGTKLYDITIDGSVSTAGETTQVQNQPGQGQQGAMGRGRGNAPGEQNENSDTETSGT